MNATDAAQKLAELINAIESAGLSMTFSRSEIRVDDTSILVGRFEGDPWVVQPSVPVV